MLLRIFFLAQGLILAGVALYAEPVPLWSYAELEGSAVSPCVADVLESPGQETIVAGGDSGVVQCLSALGVKAWESKTPLGERIALSPSVSGILPSGKRAVAVVSESGLLSCIDATSGSELWRQAVGDPCTGLTWSDLDGNTGDELVAYTRTKGIVVFSIHHTETWRFTDSELGRPMTLAGPGAVFDVDQDRRMEVFAAEAQEAICLDAKGALIWKVQPESLLTGAMALTGPDQEGIPRLYCAGKGAVLALDAGIGDLLWTCPVGLADSGAMPYLALGDLDRDEALDVVMAVPGEGLVAVGSDGKLLWTFQDGKSVASPAIIADVDADTALEIVVSGAGNCLLVISSGGELKASWSAQGPVRHSPLVADVKGDGRTALLYSDNAVRCCALGSAYVKPFMPWPMEGASMNRSYAIEVLQEGDSAVIEDTRPLLDNGSFEQPEGGQLQGWVLEQPEAAACALDSEIKLAGAHAVRVQPVAESAVLLSTLLPIPSELNAITASVMGRGPGAAHATVRWLGKQGVLREEPLQEQPDPGTGWKRFLLNNTRTPLGAHFLCMTLTSHAPGGAPVYWDEAQITGVFRLIPQVYVGVNQVGYEIKGPKQFTAWSNFKANNVKYEIIGGEKSLSGSMTDRTRIMGGYASDWGYYYWRGDFTSFDYPGKYTIKVTMDAVSVESVPFAIEADLLWTATLPLALTCFKYQRCGVNIPGGHLPCHLDDAVEQQSLTGGWHDGAGYSKRNTVSFTLELATAFSIVRHRFGTAFPSPLGKDFLEEALWGADLVLRSVKADGSVHPDLVSAPGYCGPPEKETDNQPGTGDERKPDPDATGDASVHAAALARVARIAADKTEYGEAAARSLQWALEHDQRGPMSFGAAMDLFLAVQQESYAQTAQALLPAPGLAWSENTMDYDAEFDPDVPSSFPLALMLREQAAALIAEADNPFGVYAPKQEGQANFFNTPSDKGGVRTGNTRTVLEAAVLVAKAYRFNPLPEYKRFIMNQFNWILGNNPESISLMEGAGKTFLPTYYHCYEEGGLARGAVPGAIANGFTGRGPGDDRPFIDMSGKEKPDEAANGFDLNNTLLYLKALCHLKRSIALE